MKFLSWLLLVVSPILLLSFDGFDVGNWDRVAFDVGSKANPLDSLAPYHLRVHTPLSCTSFCGDFSKTTGLPVFLFVTAFAGAIDAYSYDVVLDGIARHGIIVVAVDLDMGFTLTVDYHKLAKSFNKVITYLRNLGTGGLLADLRLNGYTGTIYQQAAKIIIGGHSSGIHIALQYVKDNGEITESCPDIGGVVMLSPMDGQDPVGFGGDFLVDASGNDFLPLPMVTPGLIVSGSLDGAFPPIIIGAACTPDDRGNEHFYKAWQGRINMITATGMGTLDILNEASDSSYHKYCAASNRSESAARLKYRAMTRGAIVSFIQGTILARQSSIDLLSSASALNFPAVTKKKGQGISFTCSWDPATEGLSSELQTGIILFGILFALTFCTGLYCFFRKMDDDTLHRYHPTEGISYDQPASFKTKLEPEYSQQYSQQNSFNFGSPNSRTPSVNV